MVLNSLISRIRRWTLRHKSFVTIPSAHKFPLRFRLPLLAVTLLLLGILGQHLARRSHIAKRTQLLPSSAYPLPTATPATAVAALPGTPPGITASWDGQPPPGPGHYLRETPEYQRWRGQLWQLFDEWTRQGKTTVATTWRTWLRAYEAAELCQLTQPEVRQDAVLPPMPANAVLRRRLGPPPSPAFVDYYGYKVVVPWNSAVYYYAADAIPPDSPFLLHTNGISASGVPLRKRPDVHALFSIAGITDPVAQDVLIKVSQYEGGFEAVNTWDTGYVSVGFIQFTTGGSGEGYPLLQVLQRMKAAEALRAAHTAGYRSEFACYFTDRGLDVRDGKLYVRDPATGTTQAGSDAVALLIKDKRLIALFQEAGCKSRAFQLAQLREAYGAYYLANTPFSIPVAEVCVYQAAPPPKTTPTEIKDTTSTSTPMPGKWQLVKRRYVYGPDAVQRETTASQSPAHFARYVDVATPGATARVARRLPNLTGTYRAILRSEGGQVMLTQQAVRCGVRRAMASFAASLGEVVADHQPTLAELSQHEPEIVTRMHDHLNALMQPGSKSEANQQ